MASGCEYNRDKFTKTNNIRVAVGGAAPDFLQTVIRFKNQGRTNRQDPREQGVFFISPTGY